MTAALVIVSLVLATSLAINVRLVLWARTDSAETDALKTQSATYERQRNDAIAKHDVALKRIGELEALLRSASAARDEATKETIRAKADRIRNAPDGKTAVVELGSVFSVPILSAVPKAGDTASGNGDSGAGGVPPT